MSDQQFLDKEGLETLVDKIKTKDIALQNAITTAAGSTKYEQHILSYYMYPDSNSPYEVICSDGAGNRYNFGGWYCYTLENQYSDIFAGVYGRIHAPIVNKELINNPSNGYGYDDSDSAWIKKYTDKKYDAEGNSTEGTYFLSRPLKIKEIRYNKTSYADENSLLTAIKSELGQELPQEEKYKIPYIGAHIYTPNHILLNNTSGSDSSLMKFNGVTTMLYINHWDYGHGWYSGSTNTIQYGRVMNVITNNTGSNVAQNWQNDFVQKFPTNETSGYGDSTHRVFPIRINKNPETLRTVMTDSNNKQKITLMKLNSTYPVYNFLKDKQYKGLYNVINDKDVPSYYSGLLVVGDENIALYNSEGDVINFGSSISIEVKKNISNLRSFNSLIEEMYFVPNQNYYTHIESKELEEEFWNFQYIHISFYTNSTDNTLKNGILFDVKRDPFISGEEGSVCQYIRFVDGYYNIYEKSPVLGASVRINLKLLDSTHTEDTYIDLGKLYIKSDNLTNSSFYNFTIDYSYIKDYKNSPSICKFINDSTSVSEKASYWIKEIFIETATDVDDIKYIPGKTGNGSNFKFYLDELGSNKINIERIEINPDSGKPDVVFYVKNITNTTIGNHTYNNYEKIENTNIYRRQINSLGSGNNKITFDENYYIYLVLNEDNFFKGATENGYNSTNTYLYWNKATNPANSPTIQSYLMIKKLTESK